MLKCQLIGTVQVVNGQKKQLKKLQRFFVCLVLFLYNCNVPNLSVLLELYISSVTRWLEYFSNIWLFTTTKNGLKAYKKFIEKIV